MYKAITCSLILGISAASTLASGSASAASERAQYSAPPSTEETTGFFSGVLLGGLAGGPPGVIVGGALGALVGDGWHARRRVGDLQADLYASQLEAAMMREANEILQQEYQLARQQLDGVRSANARYQHATLVQPATSVCCNNTALTVHFRSGSTTIEQHYIDQLAGLIKLAHQMPSVSVEITGYADRNGDADSNLALSRARSESVKAFLHEQGITDSAITTVAHGETRPVQSQQDLETDFFDRRVIVRLQDTSQQMLTHSPDGK